MNSARSFLFVPGDRPERFDKAVGAGADCTILDLEDAVRPEDKEAAREHIRSWLAAGHRAAIRINPVGTSFHQGDLEIAAMPGVTAVLLPKAEIAQDCRDVLGLMAAGVALLPLIETARGLLSAPDIAAVDGVVRLLFGSVDFQSDCGIADDADGLRHARSALVIASAAAGIAGPVGRGGDAGAGRCRAAASPTVKAPAAWVWRASSVSIRVRSRRSMRALPRPGPKSTPRAASSMQPTCPVPRVRCAWMES